MNHDVWDVNGKYVETCFIGQAWRPTVPLSFRRRPESMVLFCRNPFKRKMISNHINETQIR